MTDEKEKSGAMPRQYDQAFKQEAVCFWRSSGQAAEHTARQLGIFLRY
ncbi:MAG: hypothetical protein QM715_13195 [Nibricoccus sp.]